MELRLKPQETVEIIDSSFRLYKNNFIKFVMILAPIQIISFCTGTIYQGALRMIGVFGGMKSVGVNFGMGIAGILFSIVFGIVSLVLRCIAMGALVYSVSGAYVGKDIEWRQSYKGVRSQFLPLVGIGFLSWLMVTAGCYMLVIPGVILGVFLSLVIPVMIIENKRVGDTIRRSFELVSYKFWKVFLCGFISFLIIGIASGIASLPFFIYGMIKGMQHTSPAPPSIPFFVEVLQLALANFIGLLTAPFWMIVFTLLYYDLRIRKEGFDLEMMAKGLGYHTTQSQET